MIELECHAFRTGTFYNVYLREEYLAGVEFPPPDGDECVVHTSSGKVFPVTRATAAKVLTILENSND